jgi:hypothetical protein
MIDEPQLERLNSWIDIVRELRFLFGNERLDPKASLEEARIFFHSALPSIHFGIAVSCFLMNEAWSPSETWQVWDLIQKDDFVEVGASNWFPDFLSSLDYPSTYTFDISRLATLVRSVGLDLGKDCLEWLCQIDDPAIHTLSARC